MNDEDREALRSPGADRGATGTSGAAVAGTPALGLPAWAVALAILSLVWLYTLTLDNGLVLGAAAETVHELFHDGRHFFGVPCH
ncbi:MAG: CbtB domain-containing protein [Acidimicrobiales bacterium]